MRWWLRAALLSLLAGAGAEGSGQSESQAVVGRVGGSTVLGCGLLGAHEARPPLYVIEWVRFGFILPIFIKFGLYSPRVDPEYVGRVRIEEGASLRIDLLRAEDQGWYECRVLFLDQHSTDADFQNGTWIHLTVNAPPTFLETPPAFVEVRDQDALSLTCTAAGNPQPVVIWKRSDLAVQSGDTVQVRNGTLSIAVVERTSAGTYTCHASSKEGTITHTTRVLVQGPPVIVVPPQNITVNVSQDVFLACQAEAYPGNLTYTWFQGNSNVFHLSHLQARVRVLVDGSLLLQRTTPDDAGKYTCIPSNGLWKPPSASAFVTVLYPAQVTTMLPETPLPKGMQGVIRCPARANPPLLSVSWTRDGRPLELDKLPGWSTRPDGSIVIATGNDDALGVYTCTPYNSYGTAGTSQPTRVLLKDPPAFTVRPKEEYFQEVGRELVIPCAAHGDPPPTVAWLKVGSTGKSGAQVDGNSSLVFRPLVKEQHGVWECVATNQVASVSTATSVHVLGTSPHAVTNVSVLPLLLAANISWEPGFDGGYFQRFSVWYTPLLPSDHSASRAAGHDHAHLPVPAAGSDGQRDCAWGPAAMGAPSSVLGGAEWLRAGAAAGQGWLGGAGPLHPQHRDPDPGAGTDQGRLLRVPTGGLCWQLHQRSQQHGECLHSRHGGVSVSHPAARAPAAASAGRGHRGDLLPQRGCHLQHRGRLHHEPPACCPHPEAKASNSRGSGSPDSTVKLKLQPSPYRSLRRTLLWGEKAGTSLGLSITGASSRYAVYESHVGEHVPLERICRGPDGRFVVETNTRPQESGCGVLPYTKPEPYLQQDPLGPQPEPYLQLPTEEEEEEEEPIWRKGVSLRPRPTGQAYRGACAAGYRQGRYFGYSSSSSPVDEAAALCIVNISPVASAATLPYSTVEEPRDSPGSALWDSLPLEGSRRPPLGPLAPPSPSSGGSRQPASPPAQSGILQYLSLPFFKEMCVDGDWPPPEEPAEPGHASGQPQPEPAASPPPALPGTGGSPQRAGQMLCPDCVDTCANVTSPPATAFLKPPPLPPGPGKASLPGTAAWPGSASPGAGLRLRAQLAHGTAAGSARTEAVPSASTAEPSAAPGRPPDPSPLEKLPRGSLTSQSSGRGSASFLRPPSLAPSLGVNCLGPTLGDGGSWHGGGGSVAEEGRARTDPALGGVGKRRNTSVDENYEWDAEFALESDILEALQLYRSGDPARPVSTIALRDLERQKPGGGSSPVSSVSAEALAAAGSPRDRGTAQRQDPAPPRRPGEGARPRLRPRGGCAERFELATLL
ncbi:protein turtle homolog A isoform X2 [Strix uralensis]|uniref:protein turtle homolog A isoform X2 n=1 Tax=Strix uralensis TaxID=36305 RepID=UPI003DA7542A